MIAEAVDYLEIVDRMPHEGTLTFHNVSWDEYEDVIVEMESHPGWRVSYNDGLLKFMSPRSLHEFIKEIVHGLVIVYAETFDTDVETYGSTAYRARKKAKGAEPDTSFYVQNARAMRGKDHIDLEIDLPPDVVVEIDTTNESTDKLAIYADLGVPEVWLHDGREFQILILDEGRYVPSDRGNAFPLITGDILTEYLDVGKTDGTTAMIKSFRRFLQDLQ